MKHWRKTSTVLVLALLGASGCGKKQPPVVDQTQHVQALEANVAHLEEGYQAAASARDQLRKQVAVLEEERTHWHKECVELQQKCWSLQVQLTVTEEEGKQLQVQASQREALQTQLDLIRRSLHEALNQVDGTAATATTPHNVFVITDGDAPLLPAPQ